MLILGVMKSGEDYRAFIDRALVEIALPVSLESTLAQVTASIGVTIYPLDDVDDTTLIKHADAAMYQAKESGKSRYCLHGLANERAA